MGHIGTELLLTPVGLYQRSHGQPRQPPAGQGHHQHRQGKNGVAKPPQAIRLGIELGQAAGDLQIAPDRFARSLGVVKMDRVGAPAPSGPVAGQNPARLPRCRFQGQGAGGAGNHAALEIQHPQLESIWIGGADAMAMDQIRRRTAGLPHRTEAGQHRSDVEGGWSVFRQGGPEAVMQGAGDGLQLPLDCPLLGLQQQSPHGPAGPIEQAAHHQQ